MINKLQHCWLWIAFILILQLYSTKGWTQNKDSTKAGIISGVVKDSGYNYVLQFASVAVYSKDTNLITYQLCDGIGAFIFSDLPIGVTLDLRVFYTGYETKVIKFEIIGKGKPINFENILLKRNENELDEVVVKAIAPVRMNGDTLEFNANAFQLDKNAVGEDLLRRLPGVTVWSDGSITVNGKQVSKVLVDGRTFFGTDPRMATQNISKGAIDKIQVYQNVNLNNPLDSTTSINIKLKKEKNFGHFGKIGVGLGSDRRSSTEGNINLFSPRTQLGLVGNSNNVNKIANDAGTLLKNSTYKGNGANVEYQTDFSLPGRNQTNSVGVVFQHDFLANINPDKKDMLSGNFFYNKNDNNTEKSVQTITSLVNNDLQFLNAYTNLFSINSDNKWDALYIKKRRNSEFKIETNAELLSNTFNSLQQTSLSDRFQTLQSTSNSSLTSYNQANNIVLNSKYAAIKNPYSLNRIPGDLEISYTFSNGNFIKDELVKSEFKSITDSRQNKNFNRIYNSSGEDTKQQLLTNIGDFSNWIIRRKNWLLSGLNIKIQNYIEVIHHREVNKVNDIDSLSGGATLNKNLTSDSRYNIINENPSCNISRNITRTFDARYQKSLLINIQFQQQFYKMENVSTQSFQNISYNYSKFIPVAEIIYSNYQFGECQNIYNIKFMISSEYPTIFQLMPIIDSLNLYYIQRGNPNLRPTDRKEFIVSWHHNSFRMKNSFFYGIDLKGGLVNKSFSDSSFTDNLGRTSTYVVNVNGRKYLQLAGKLNKALKFGKIHQVQIALSPSLGLESVPNSINNVWNISESFNLQNTLDILYTYKDWVALNFKQMYYYYYSHQQIYSDKSFHNTLVATSVSANATLTRKLNLGTNINFNSNSSTGQNLNKFTIWNVNTSYRFLQDNSLEIRLSALDLLHQNAGIVYGGSNNKIVNGSASVLQQYFMITLSYFPRKFGKVQTGSKL